MLKKIISLFLLCTISVCAMQQQTAQVLIQRKKQQNTPKKVKENTPKKSAVEEQTATVPVEQINVQEDAKTDTKVEQKAKKKVIKLCTICYEESCPYTRIVEE